MNFRVVRSGLSQEIGNTFINVDLLINLGRCRHSHSRALRANLRI